MLFRSHAEKGRGQGGVASNFFVQVIVVVPASVSVGCGDLSKLDPSPAFGRGQIPAPENTLYDLSVGRDFVKWYRAIEGK